MLSARPLTDRLRTATRIARAAGIDPVRVVRVPTDAFHYVKDLRSYRRMLNAAGQGDHEVRLYPVLGDHRSPAGAGFGHYFHQDLWAAKQLIAAAPRNHVDIGSRIAGFVAHLLAASVPITVVDLRPLAEPVEGLTFVQDDATTLRSFEDGSIDSLSSLHAVEHIGLARYGDRLDPEGHLVFCATLQRKLASGGRLLVSAPIGRERTEFNAHRVLRPGLLIDAFSELTLTAFAAVDDGGRLVDDAEPSDFADARFSLGLYSFEKTDRRSA